MSAVRRLKDEIAKAQGALQTKLVELYLKVKDPALSVEERTKITNAIAELKASIKNHLDTQTGRLRGAIQRENAAR
jgi:hypothetical protein